MMQLLGVAKRLTFSFFVFISIMILMLGSESIYGTLAPQMNSILQIYMMMLLFSAVYFMKTQHKMQLAGDAIPAFLVMFLVTLILMAFIGPMMKGVLVASTLESSLELVFTFGLLHAFVKAYVEEEVFRGRLAVILGEIGQAMVFGLFHFFVLLMVLGWTPMLFVGMLWLMSLGYVWGKVEDRFGLAGSTGSHFAYNLVVMGVGAFIFGAVVI